VTNVRDASLEASRTFMWWPIRPVSPHRYCFRQVPGGSADRGEPGDCSRVFDPFGDETGDEKSSADAVGAARQYSGALGGIGPCQVAVHLTYASRLGQAIVDRART